MTTSVSLGALLAGQGLACLPEAQLTIETTPEKGLRSAVFFCQRIGVRKAKYTINLAKGVYQDAANNTIRAPGGPGSTITVRGS